EVRARYADGRAEDVTHWARFATTADAVAGVDEYGQVTVAGPGEAAVTATFAGRGGATVVTVPHDRTVDSRLFTESPRHNFSDEHVLKKLESLRIPPSPQCTDREFVRRAFLDCTGTLPTPEEVERFVAGAGVDKRAKLVDALLARPEFVDY